MTKQYLCLLGLFLIMIPFQNCGRSFRNETPRGAPVSFASESGLQKDALQIISYHCGACHGPQGQGDVINITDVNHLIAVGLITPGDPDDGRLIGSIEDGTMPLGIFPPEDLATLKNWVVSLAPPTPPPTSTTSTTIMAPTLASCQVVPSTTQVTTGQPLTLSLIVQGNTNGATLNGQPIAATGGSITLTPTMTKTYSGTVTNTVGTATCTSATVTVVAAGGPTAPTCSLTSSANNIVPGDSTMLTMTVTGPATSATLNGIAIAATGGSTTVKPNLSTTYTGSVTGTAGTSTCAVNVTALGRAALTKDEFYRATVGPNNQSMDQLLVRCTHCHSQTANPTCGLGATTCAEGPKWLFLIPGDFAGNLARLRNVKNPKTGAFFSNMTIPNSTCPSGQPYQCKTVWQFMNGHKAKNPPYTPAELTLSKDFVLQP